LPLKNIELFELLFICGMVALGIGDHRLLTGLDELAMRNDEFVEIIAGRIFLASFRSSS